MATFTGKKHKEKIILVLLALSSLTAAVVLYNTSPTENNNLKSLAQVDSLIVDHFRSFNIQGERINKRTITAADSFSRVVYQVEVPRNFAESHWHYTLHKKILPLGLQDPARVDQSEQKTRIHLIKKRTVFRTIEFKADTTSYMQRHQALIFMRFEEIPSRNQITEIERLGEPIPIIVPSKYVLDLEESQRDLFDHHSRIVYAMSSSQDNRWADQPNSDAIIQKLKRLHKIDRTANIVLYDESFTSMSSGFRQRVFNTGTGIYVVNPSVVVADNKSEYHFETQLKQLLDIAKEGQIPAMVVEGSTRNIDWLHNLLPEYRKQGLFIRAPRTLNP